MFIVHTMCQESPARQAPDLKPAVAEYTSEFGLIFLPRKSADKDLELFLLNYLQCLYLVVTLTNEKQQR